MITGKAVETKARNLVIDTIKEEGAISGSNLTQGEGFKMMMVGVGEVEEEEGDNLENLEEIEVEADTGINNIDKVGVEKEGLSSATNARVRVIWLKIVKTVNNRKNHSKAKV